MTPSSVPGNKPSVSSHLANFLVQPDNESLALIGDEFDRLIEREQLRISRFVYVRELDLALLIFTNRRIISQTLSAFPILAGASDDALNDYILSPSGIRGPALDADLSVRGLLMSELMKAMNTAPVRS